MVLVMMTIAATRIRFMFFSLGLWDLISFSNGYWPFFDVL